MINYSNINIGAVSFLTVLITLILDFVKEVVIVGCIVESIMFSVTKTVIYKAIKIYGKTYVDHYLKLIEDNCARW